jgi:hypothetical protein
MKPTNEQSGPGWRRLLTAYRRVDAFLTAQNRIATVAAVIVLVWGIVLAVRAVR